MRKYVVVLGLSILSLSIVEFDYFILEWSKLYNKVIFKLDFCYLVYLPRLSEAGSTSRVVI